MREGRGQPAAVTRSRMSQPVPTAALRSLRVKTGGAGSSDWSSAILGLLGATLAIPIDFFFLLFCSFVFLLLSQQKTRLVSSLVRNEVGGQGGDAAAGWLL